MDIRYDQVRAFFMQILAQSERDIPDPLHSYSLTFQRIAAESRLGRRLHSLVHTEGRSRGRVAGGAVGCGNPGNIISLLMDDIHIRFRGAYILSCNVTPVKSLYVSAEGAEHRLVFVFFRIANDDRLAAAEVQSGYRILISHPLG
ncbi:hypothetical protein D3C73_1175470 [compost metagenome]